MATIDERQALVAAIEGVEREVVAVMVAEIFHDPFWIARYGARAPAEVEQDPLFSLRHLVNSIANDDHASLRQHYRWLRGVLIDRGMCTLHLRAALDLIERELSTRLPAAWMKIMPYHASAYAGLAYQRPASQALSAAEYAIAEAVTDRMFSPLRMVAMRDGDQARANCLRDQHYHLSYLADAVEADQEELFAQYLAFLVGFFPTEGTEVETLRESMRLLSDEIYFALPDEFREPVLAVLEHSVERAGL